jgi:bla regulator protein BlaR1
VIGDGLNHLWQSTVFAVAVGLLTIAFRHNRAHVRYWLWFGASVKFFIPFTFLIDVGSLLPLAQAAHWLAPQDIAVTIVQISQPFPDSWPSMSSAPATPDLPRWLGFTILGVWACGFGSIAWIRLQMWRRIRAVVRASTPFQILGTECSARVQLRSASGLLEPGVVGWLRPILLLPAGIEKHLTPPQLAAVLAHELCHVGRRDNFTAGIHMVSEAVFWFHPVVWWIGARLVDERESACDEEVVRLGSNPRVYAESILKTCQFYGESPLSCAAGVTGSNLTKRIEAIMRNQAGRAVGVSKKLLLGIAIVLTVAIPVGVGVLDASGLHSEPVVAVASGSALEVASSGLQIDATNFCCPDYLIQMIDRIRVNWGRQSEVDGSNVVMFTIQRDGRIVDVMLEKSSGFQNLDESSQRAVSATNDLTALPARFPNPTLTVHLGFAYQR